MNLQLKGKRAIVTGGNRGIGLAVARILAAEGAQVAIAARYPTALVDSTQVANLIAFLASPLSAAITGDAIGARGGIERSIHY